jgi:type IV secretion system protein VirD4
MQQTQGFHEVISRNGKLLEWMVDRELGSVMTTVQRHTAWMDSPQAAACLSHTSFDPRLLKTGCVTVYFVLPPDKLETLAALMRTWIGCTLRISTRDGADERNPVLFLLDEAGHLGHMQALQDAVTLLRGYGIRLWFFFQDLGQLLATYGKHASVMLGNMQTQQYFAINNYETAEAVSKRIGEETISVRTDNGGGGTSWATGPGPNGPQPGNRSNNWGWSTSATGRSVFKPEEIMVLPDDTALIFHRNNPVIPARLLRYFDAPEFKNGGDGRQGGMVQATFLTMAVAVLISAAMIPMADEGHPPVPQPDFQAGDEPASPRYGIDLRRPTIHLSPIPKLPTPPVPHVPDTSNPWKFDGFKLKDSSPTPGSPSG